MTLNLHGKCSTFGGPDDLGVAPDEGLALYSDWTQKPELFLSYQPEGTSRTRATSESRKFLYRLPVGL